MKKKASENKSVKYVDTDQLTNVEEPVASYMKSFVAFPGSHTFTFQEFKPIADNTPFTMAEWSKMLHISERTLQRYAKNNSAFAPINAERAIQIIKLLYKGKEVLGSIDKFYNWLNRNPYMLEGNLSLQSLTTSDGISNVFTQLNRIEQGLFA
jgi:putative toxin-antitoxin system antitoxin component (TIGR02293 family)